MQTQLQHDLEESSSMTPAGTLTPVGHCGTVTPLTSMDQDINSHVLLQHLFQLTQNIQTQVQHLQHQNESMHIQLQSLVQMIHHGQLQQQHYSQFATLPCLPMAMPLTTLPQQGSPDVAELMHRLQHLKETRRPGKNQRRRQRQQQQSKSASAFRASSHSAEKSTDEDQSGDVFERNISEQRREDRVAQGVHREEAHPSVDQGESATANTSPRTETSTLCAKMSEHLGSDEKMCATTFAASPLSCGQSNQNMQSPRACKQLDNECSIQKDMNDASLLGILTGNVDAEEAGDIAAAIALSQGKSSFMQAVERAEAIAAVACPDQCSCQRSTELSAMEVAAPSSSETVSPAGSGQLIARPSSPQSANLDVHTDTKSESATQSTISRDQILLIGMRCNINAIERSNGPLSKCGIKAVPMSTVSQGMTRANKSGDEGTLDTAKKLSRDILVQLDRAPMHLSAVSRMFVKRYNMIIHGRSPINDGSFSRWLKTLPGVVVETNASGRFHPQALCRVDSLTAAKSMSLDVLDGLPADVRANNTELCAKRLVHFKESSCARFESGHCSKGHLCTHAHGRDDLQRGTPIARIRAAEEHFRNAPTTA
eukprot:gnl/MRDRNA2_/MRDRNA2_202502_c0_seq1.p1 gnl/MRDRNA2_/MRDRNA2_202502_c0~~gnl/MRDRNA2_/MRDRNA2_202502_c0_seq1.p1  ORF type:complete len:597 (-),score=98.74 gnl/MRDRNA2_/MRDRNA2_202502_c0_seq1:396-2186(-)